MACTWLGEFSSCFCLTALPSPAWVLLSKIYKPFPGSLYMYNFTWKRRVATDDEVAVLCVAARRCAIITAMTGDASLCHFPFAIQVLQPQWWM